MTHHLFIDHRPVTWFLTQAERLCMFQNFPLSMKRLEAPLEEVSQRLEFVLRVYFDYF